ARLVGRHSEERLVDHLPQRGGGDADLGPRCSVSPEWELGKVLRLQADDPELGASGEEIDPARLGRLDDDLLGAHLPRDLVQLARVQGDRALLLHLSGDATSEPHLHVGAGQGDPALDRFQQHVGENRERVPPLDHTLYEIQPSYQMLTLDRDLHVLPRLPRVVPTFPPSYGSSLALINAELVA